MKIILKKFANLLTIATTIFLVVGVGYAILKSQPISDLVSEIAFCYLTVAVFNYIVFGSASLWHKKADI